MVTSTAAADAGDAKRRRQYVEERLRLPARIRLARRSLPPEGRLGSDEQPMRALRATLIDLGPLFVTFGRYLSSRLDLLSRRDCAELAALPDRGDPLDEAQVSAVVQRDLGAPPEERFFAFDFAARRVRTWTEEHDAWVSPGVPAAVTIVRPDAGAFLASDLPLLRLLAPWLGISESALTGAIQDFSITLQQRLDQRHQASAFAKLAADLRIGGLFDAPGTYLDHCGHGVLTRERLDGIPVDDALRRGDELPVDFGLIARRIAGAWLRQATVGQVVPYEFDLRDVMLLGDRLLLVGGSLEAHSSASRGRFLNYLNAVAGDDPDTAATWLLSDAVTGPDSAVEEELRRRLRQAVPFRDGEWSGEDRLAEQLLVQWRMAQQAGWSIHAHQLHIYRGIHAVSALTTELAPETDALLAALQEERLRVGFGTVQPLFDPRAIPAALDKLFQDMVNLPQKLDQVLTQAADGRLRVKLNVPRDEEHRRARNRTVSLVAGLVVLTALAFAVRDVAFAQTPGVEQLGALAVMIVGAWLLVAAARL